MNPAKLIEKAKSMTKRAYCPHSNYQVGAALLTQDNRIFTGVNVENASYGLTICAERTAVLNAVTAGCRKFKAMAVVAANNAAPASGKKRPAGISSKPEFPYPCGACRQVLSEFCGADFPIYIATADNTKSFRKIKLGDLLPHAFKINTGVNK